MALRPCLVCGTPAEGSRCPLHKLRRETKPHAPYDRRHRALTRAVVEAWVRRYGWVCPGYQIAEHPVPPGGLEGEHIIPRSVRPDLAYDIRNYSVLCRVCNARKGDRVD